MKIILLKDIDKLGSKGDIVEVKDGYARNYLIPKGFALEATPYNLEVFEKKKRQEEIKYEKRKKEALVLAEKISHLSLTLPVQAKEDEELYGSVNQKMISKALKEEGYDIDEEKIVLPEPIKKLGIYNIKLKLHPEVEAEFKLWVVKK